MAKKKKAPSQLNETGNRNKTERRAKVAPVTSERRKVQRRRQIDPTTCERDYKDAEIEFMHALDAYKRANGRMFPTCSEILEVLQKLGYRKVAEDCQACGLSADSNSELTEQVDETLESLEELAN
jgi:hypothetical protein